MKKLLSILLLLYAGMAAYAVPAYPKPVVIHQADGTYITIVGHGDEFNNFITTEDGYTVVLGSDKVYHYAQLQNGSLVTSGVKAHDAGKRSVEERQYLADKEKNIRSTRVSKLTRLAPVAGEREPGVKYSDDVPWLEKRRAAGNSSSAKGYSNKPYRGLVILANYNDCKFMRGDKETKQIFTTLMNGRNVTSFDDPMLGKQKVTGSVRDYFNDNSYGQFDPQFDVVGPVNIDKSQYDMCCVDNSIELTETVVDAVDSIVDFSNYDADGDGVVDMFYIIYAGRASSYVGNDTLLVWPHANTIGETLDQDSVCLIKDNVRLFRYACSTEIYGWEREKDMQINGVGVICHEFSHVLGYRDHYDSTNKGHENPCNWDVMANGCYNGDVGETPAGYNAYERMTGGFMSPVTLTADDANSTVSLQPLETEGAAYRINSKDSNDEYFLFENRQLIKWDSWLPEAGMLVWRVDSTDTSFWEANQVNAGDQLCLQLVRANGWEPDMDDSVDDLFPGTKNVTTLSNTTSPANLLSHTGTPSPLILEDITHSSGIVSFKVVEDNASTGIEGMADSTASATDAHWYNTLGQRVSSNARGLVIHEGKKILR